MQKKEKFIGVDVSKATLDMAVYGTREHIRISNNAEGLKQLKVWLKELQISLEECWFVFEYTGGYEYRLLQFCISKNIAFTRLPGLEIKKSLGIQRGKNDKIDAKRIAEYGYQKREKLQQSHPTDASIERLKQLLTQRTAFVNDRKKHQVRLKALQSVMDFKSTDPMIKHYRHAITFAQKMIDQTEVLIKELIENNPQLKKNFRIITSIPGIGNVNAWMMIAYTENFQKFSCARKFGSYCGIVPFEYTSGTSIKYRSRTSHLANKEIKANLNMAAKASIAFDPEIKTYYERRKLIGKHHMAIMNEVKFKLVLRMFSVVKKQEYYVKIQKSAA